MLSCCQKNTLFSRSSNNAISVEAFDPDVVLANKEFLSNITDLVSKAFTFHNPNINHAYENSNNKDEFLELSRAQVFDSIQQISKANKTKKNDGIILLARDTSKVNQPIVGIVSGVRNGHPHPSHEYMDKLFRSECGLGTAIGAAFSSVLSQFNIEKIEKFNNMFMLGLIAVSQESMRHGVATKLAQALHETLIACQYDGLFSIITSPRAEGLLNKFIGDKIADTTTYKKLESAENSTFFGIALNKNGLDTLNAFDNHCRQKIYLK